MTRHPSRRPLLLAVENECGLQKFVSTTIIPTEFVYPEFNSLSGCSSFVADHIKYEPIPEHKVTSLPEKLLSPETVLRMQRGNCFEMATLLVSLLMGSGFNAFVVYGYATLEFCVNDLRRTDCPLLIEPPPKEEPPPPPSTSKYVARPKRDLRSQFELMLAEQKEAAILEEERKLAEEEMMRILEMEKPDPDPLFGWRIHSWVVVLPGQRDVTEPFFIEVASGYRHELSEPNYLGIESIWNNTNYWINMQFCDNGCQDLSFDLSNTELWEHLLPGEPWYMRKVPSDNFTFTEEKDTTLQEKHLDMPIAWVSRLELPRNVYTMRYPNGTKTISYRKTRCDLYAPYVHKDGLVWRTIEYKDYENYYPVQVTECYLYRDDYLTKTVRNVSNEVSWQYYNPGREDALKEYKVTNMNEKDDFNFKEIKFYHKARYDGMMKLEMGPQHLVEYFVDREDKLQSRFCKLEQGEDGSPHHKVLYVCEKYDRNFDLSADQDVAKKEFLLESNEIIITYHYKDDEVTAKLTRLSKSSSLELGPEILFDEEAFSVYQPDRFSSEVKRIVLYKLLLDNIQHEKVTLQHIREIEDEIYNMIRNITAESFQVNLKISIFDEERNEGAKREMMELEKLMKLKELREIESYVDYLSPYILAKDLKEPLTLEKAVQARDSCLEDYKTNVVNWANKIRQFFEKIAGELADMQREHNSLPSDKMTPESEDKYLENLKKKITLLNIVDTRLERHRNISTTRYRALVQWLEDDRRLAIIKQAS